MSEKLRTQNCISCQYYKLYYKTQTQIHKYTNTNTKKCQNNSELRTAFPANIILKHEYKYTNTQIQIQKNISELNSELRTAFLPILF